MFGKYIDEIEDSGHTQSICNNCGIDSEYLNWATKKMDRVYKYLIKEETLIIREIPTMDSSSNEYNEKLLRLNCIQDVKDIFNKPVYTDKENENSSNS